MVYVANDGTVHENAPWGLDKLIRFFYGLIYFVIFFFKSLVGLDTSSYTYSGPRRSGVSFGGSTGDGGSTSGRSGGSGGGGGGGSGPFRPGGGGGGSSRRFMTMRDVNPPTVGGCPGGACFGGGCG